MRLGVIGAGWFVSRRHLPDAMANTEIQVTALCRRDASARSTILSHFNLPGSCGFDDWQTMLDEAPLDAVLIATPNSLHYEHAKTALQRGLHVLLEKPMTVRSEDARDLVRIANENNLKLSVALNPPFWAHCHRAKQALQSVRMGQLESASIYWTGSAEHLFNRNIDSSKLPGIVPPTSYRADTKLNGGGYFVDGGPHLVSELLWLTGMRVTKVSALMDQTPDDMRISASFLMENGAIANICSTGDSKYSSRRVQHVFGASNGVVSINGADFHTTIEINGEDTQSFRETDLPKVSNPVTNFADAILHNAELYSPAEHGAHVVEVVEAVYRSAASGRAIDISV